MNAQPKKVREILTIVGGEILVGSPEVEVIGCYVGDLLSDVLANARPGVLWITIQTHRNIVSVASMKDIPVILVSRNRRADTQTLAEAEDAGITIATTALTSYEAAGKLWEAGLR